MGSIQRRPQSTAHAKLYATSHAELDRDAAVRAEVANAATALIEAVNAARTGRRVEAGRELHEPQQK